MDEALSDTIRRKGRTLFFVDLHVEGINVGPGVHAPLAIVLGGEDRLFGSGSPAVVGGLCFGTFNLEVLQKKEWVSLRVCAMLDEPQDDGSVFVGMFRPFQFGGRFTVGKMDVTAYLFPVGLKVKC